MRLVEISKKDFNKYAEKFDNKSFFQTSYMGDVLESRGKKVLYLGIENNKSICAVTMIYQFDSFLRKSSFNCLKGFLCDYNDKQLVSFFTSELKQDIREHNGYRLIIDPYLVHLERDIDGKIVKDGINNDDIVNYLRSIGYIKSKIDTQVKTNFCLDLSNKSEDEVFSAFKPTTRNLINKSLRMGVEIVDLSYDQLSEFKKITEYTSNKRGFNDRNLEYYQQMFLNFKNHVVFKMARLNVKKHIKYLNDKKNEYLIKIENIKSSTKKKDNYMIEVQNIDKQLKKIESRKREKYINLAAAMFMLYGHETIYLFSGSYDAYNEYAGQYLIQWDIIKYAIQNHYNRHNFFGVLNYTNKNNKDYGIYQFKRGFNGYIEELIGEFYLPIGVTGFLYKIKDFFKDFFK